MKSVWKYLIVLAGYFFLSFFSPAYIMEEYGISNNKVKVRINKILGKK